MASRPMVDTSMYSCLFVIVLETGRVLRLMRSEGTNALSCLLLCWCVSEEGVVVFDRCRQRVFRVQHSALAGQKTGQKTDQKTDLFRPEETNQFHAQRTLKVNWLSSGYHFRLSCRSYLNPPWSFHIPPFLILPPSIHPSTYTFGCFARSSPH